MTVSGFPQHASVASSCDWDQDVLDVQASRIMALQLALHLQAHLIDPSPAEQTAALDVTLSPHPGPLALARDPGRSSDGSSNQTARMAGWHQGHEWQISQSPHWPRLSPTQELLRVLAVCCALMFGSGLQCIVSLALQLILTQSGFKSVHWHCLLYVLCRSN